MIPPVGLPLSIDVLASAVVLGYRVISLRQLQRVIDVGYVLL
jgi:hypothetical protein